MFSAVHRDETLGLTVTETTRRALRNRNSLPRRAPCSTDIFCFERSARRPWGAGIDAVQERRWGAVLCARIDRAHKLVLCVRYASCAAIRAPRRYATATGAGPSSCAMSFDELPDGAFPDYPVSGAPNFVSGPGFWSMLRIVGPGLRRYTRSDGAPDDDAVQERRRGAQQTMRSD